MTAADIVVNAICAASVTFGYGVLGYLAWLTRGPGDYTTTAQELQR